MPSMSYQQLLITSVKNVLVYTPSKHLTQAADCCTFVSSGQRYGEKHREAISIIRKDMLTAPKGFRRQKDNKPQGMLTQDGKYKYRVLFRRSIRK
jgi:hypothetical protein